MTEQRLREQAQALRDYINQGLDELDGPLCEHEAARVAHLVARLDVWQTHLDKWAPRKPELDRVFASADPVVREYLQDLLTLFGVTERGNHG